MSWTCLLVHLFLLVTDHDKFEMQLKSDLRSGIRKLMPNVEGHRRQMQHLLDHVLDQQVAMTDMKYRHIVSKGIVVPAQHHHSHPHVLQLL